MDVFAARQPIFNRERELYGYELLYRADATSRGFDGVDSTSSTLQLLSNSLLSIGLDRIAGGKKVFVNFDRNLLLDGVAAILPPENLIVEVLETVEPDEEVVAACDALSKKGYSIALDDFVGGPNFEALLQLARVIKVDIQTTTKADQERLLRDYQTGRQLVAEKVETEEEFRAALDAGYDLFQGYFFARPHLMRGNQIPMSKIACMRMLSEMQKEDLDFSQLERIIREDVSFPFKLLKYANSALFSFRTEIQSIEHALVLLGEQNVRHWIALAALPLLAQNKPQELVSHSLVRARFCESLAEAAGLAEPTRAFLMGLFSLLDALLDVSLEEALNQAKIGLGIREILLGTASESDSHSTLYRLVRSYERAEWDIVRDLAVKLKLPGNAVVDAYAAATLWTQQALQATLRKANTRREVRRSVDVSVKVLWQDESAREHLANAKLVNVSGFGMQFVVDAKIPLHSAISCNEPKLGINGRGSVRYCAFSKGKYVVGVEFSNGTGWRDPLASNNPARRKYS